MLTDENVFEHWIVVEDDGDHAQIPQSALGAAQNVLSLQPQLTRCIQSTIIHTIVITFCEYFDLFEEWTVNELPICSISSLPSHPLFRELSLLCARSEYLYP